MFDSRLATRATRFIELLKLTGDFHGLPFALMDWQKQIITDVYGTINERGTRQYRYIYIETAKKNAKSQLTSAIAIKQLFDKSESNGQIVICAGDREQAEQTIYIPIVEMIEQSDSLIKRVRITDSQKFIENRDTGTTLKVISAEAYTKHGWNISCCIFDELHVQPSRALYDTMMKGAGLARRQPMWWFITTAGDDPDRVTIAWEVHEKAEQILKARQSGDAEKDIPTWYPVIYSYPGEDIYNEQNWKLANPSLGTTIQIADLRELAQEARQHPADERLFRWLNLNQWTTTKLTSWLPLDLFDATVTQVDRDALAGRDIFLGGDFSTTTDLSSLCVIVPPLTDEDDWIAWWEAWIPEGNMEDRIKVDKVPYDEWANQGWITPTPGDQIDYTMIEQRILEYQQKYNLVEFGSDRTFATMLLQRLTQKGIKVVDVPQHYADLTDPMNEVDVMLRKQILKHERNDAARWCFGNTQISKNGNAQIKFVKEHRGRSVVRTKRIDMIAALVNGMARAKFYKTARSIYEGRGLITI